jgi:hypothetical protein
MGVLLHEFAGSYAQAVFQPRHVVGHQEDGNVPATVGEAFHPRVATEFEVGLKIHIVFVFGGFFLFAHLHYPS